ncbi:MAG: sulfite exporter TauE/SafE family protein [Planctomycetota bacterium]
MAPNSFLDQNRLKSQRKQTRVFFLEYSLFIFPLFTFFSAFVKAITGFGFSVVLVGLTSLFMDPQFILPLSAMLDAVSGISLIKISDIRKQWRFWRFPFLAIILGSIFGSVSLPYIPAHHFQHLMISMLILLGFWFFYIRTRLHHTHFLEQLPEKSTWKMTLVSFISGLAGGILGMPGPPIAYYFGRKLAKYPLRQSMIVLLLVCSLTRILTYTGVGLIQKTTFLYAVASFPFMYLGIKSGSRFFNKISEVTFSRLSGIFLFFVAFLHFLK